MNKPNQEKTEADKQQLTEKEQELFSKMAITGFAAVASVLLKHKISILNANEEEIHLYHNLYHAGIKNAFEFIEEYGEKQKTKKQEEGQRNDR